MITNSSLLDSFNLQSTDGATYIVYIISCFSIVVRQCTLVMVDLLGLQNVGMSASRQFLIFTSQ